MSAQDEGVRFAVAAFMEGLLLDLADAADDEEVPIGRLMGEIADREGFDVAIDWEIVRTAGDLRASARTGLARLAGSGREQR